MTEPVIVHLEEFHLNEIFPDSLPPEAVASLVSFPSFAMEYGEKTLAAGGAIQLAPGRVSFQCEFAFKQHDHLTIENNLASQPG